MASPRTKLALIFLTVFIDMVGFGIVIPVLPLYAERFAASPPVIGCLVGVYSFIQLFSSRVLGRLSDRVGRRPVLLLSIIGSSLGFTVMGLANTLWMLFLARAIDGATGGNISTAQAYIADVTSSENRSRAMGMIGAAFGLGFIFGPVLGALASEKSQSAPFFVAAALAALNAVLIYFLLPESLAPEHRSQPHEKTSIADVLRHGKGWVLGGIMAAYFVSIMGFAMMTTMFALFTQHRFDYDARHNFYLFAYIGVLAVIIQGGLLGRLVKTFGEKTLATLGAALLSASMFALPLSNGLGILLLVCAGIALGNGLLTPTLTGLASRNVDRNWQGRALGLMQSAGTMGRFIGPLLAGWLLTFDTAGPSSRYARTAFWASGSILLIALALTLGISAAPVATASPIAAAPPSV